MDIEDLSKTQFLLLTILANFVVAIATGVLTVSLLDQAPTTVTQTVNRIVDHTIETVTTEVPAVIGNSSVPSTEELLTASIASNASRTVTVRRSADGEVLGRGFLIVSARGVIVVQNVPIPNHIHITFGDGTTAEADRMRDSGMLVYYQFTQDAVLPKVPSAEFMPLGSLKQGQTLISLSGDGAAITGLLSKITAEGLYSDLPVTLPGSAVFTLSGDIAGISDGSSVIIPADSVAALISAPAQ
jgi:hypothetical protein